MSKNDEEKRQKRRTRCVVICDSEMQYMVEKNRHKKQKIFQYMRDEAREMVSRVEFLCLLKEKFYQNAPDRIISHDLLARFNHSYTLTNTWITDLITFDFRGRS